MPRGQEESAPNPAVDSLNTPRGMNNRRSPGSQPGSASGWKNSRDFEKDQDVRPSNKKDEIQHEKIPRSQSYRSEYQREPHPSPAGRLKSSSRSLSYTTPLPLFADEESQSKSASSPLTEQNLRNLLRSYKAEDSKVTHTGTVNKSEAAVVPETRSARQSPAPAVSTTALGKSGSGRASVASAPPAVTTNPTTSMRKSKSPSKSPKKQDKEKKKSKHNSDRDTHPLNLPPEQLRAHLAHMARQESESAGRMSIDRDIPDVNNHDSSMSNGGTSQPATPSREAPGAFPENDDTATNGTNGHSEERSPTPPPHKVAPPPKVDPEACKAAGNKFFKAKDYERAIQEYTKGLRHLI